MIYWIGNSENWDKPKHPEVGNPMEVYAFPLVEETVLEVAFSPVYVRYQRLSRQAAINCTSRFALRSALAPELNPKWNSWPFGHGIVVKASASCQNQGIGFALPNEYSHRLIQYDRIAGNNGVVEEYIPGPQYEADGVVIGGKVHLLAWVWQEGTDEKIEHYVKRDRADAPTEVIEEVVHTLGLDNCPFCFEMKRALPPEVGGWKIIDAHARLGEDRRLWTNQAALFERIDKIISGLPQPSPQS